MNHNMTGPGYCLLISEVWKSLYRGQGKAHVGNVHNNVRANPAGNVDGMSELMSEAGISLSIVEEAVAELIYIQL